MTAFVSWSGGKDCSLALYLFLKSSNKNISHLVNIVDPSLLIHKHCIGKDLLFAQSRALNIPLIRENITSGNNYEFHLKRIIAELKEKGVDTGVFGDIHLKEHREWIERVCNDMNITAVFPLWGLDGSDILDSFVKNGFQSIIIAVKNQSGLSALVGKSLDADIISDLKKMQGIDLCGEHGEYHTFVYNSPLYENPISFQIGEIQTFNDILYLSLNRQNHE